MASRADRRRRRADAEEEGERYGADISPGSFHEARVTSRFYDDCTKRRKPPQPAVQPREQFPSVSPIATNRSVDEEMGLGGLPAPEPRPPPVPPPQNPSARRREQFDDVIQELSDHDTSDSAPEEEHVYGPEPPPITARSRRVNESIADLEEALTNESIGKFLAYECDCGSDCTAQFTRREIFITREATHASAMQGTLPATHALHVCDTVKEKNALTGNNKFMWVLNQKEVCEIIFRMAHALSETAFRRGRLASRADLTDVPKRKKNNSGIDATVPEEQRRANGSERAGQTIEWCREWIDLHGCRMPDCNLIYIDDLSLDDLSAECGREIFDLVMPLSNRQFRRVWAKEFSKLVKKRARKPFGTCAVCAGYKARIHKHARDKMELKLVKADYLLHLTETKTERQIYYAHRHKALQGDALSSIVDGMDQSKLTLPHFKLIPKDVSNFLETKITGVLFHGKRFDCYVSEPQVPHDSNLNLTALHASLMAVLAEGNAPRKWYLQVDGGSENKNRWMLSYLSLLIEVGIFDVIKMSFLPVGHTHEDIDQAFSRIAVHLNKVDALTFEDFLAEVGKSFLKEGRPPNVVPLGVSHDFKAWLNDRLPTVASWTDNLVFRFSKNPTSGHVQMHYKYMGASPHYFGENHDSPVKSFKAVQQAAREDPNAWVAASGITMPQGVPNGQPEPADNIDFGDQNGNENNTGDGGCVANACVHWHGSVPLICHIFCRTTRERKSKADSILDTCLRAVKTHIGPGEKYDEAEASWKAKMAALKAGQGASDLLPWVPLVAPERQRAAAAPRVVVAQNAERAVRENVPQVVHGNWRDKDKKRANEVNLASMHACHLRC